MSEIKYLTCNLPFHIDAYRNVRAVLLSILLITPLLMINILQMLSSILIPFAPPLFRKINRFFANNYWGFLVYVFENLNGMKIEFLGDVVPESETVVLDSNHQSMVDTPIIMSLAYRKHRLGDLKFFAKEAIKYVPGPGWGMRFLDCIFVKRNWMSDKSTIDQTFNKIRSNRIPCWIVSFLEGTRLTPEKLLRSQRFMERRKLPKTANVMAPRTKGFYASVTGLRCHLDAVYSVTIFYPDGIPSLWQLIRGDLSRVQVHVKRTSIELVPQDVAEFESWVIESYVEKDNLLSKLMLKDRSNKLKLAGDKLFECPTS